MISSFQCRNQSLYIRVALKSRTLFMVYTSSAWAIAWRTFKIKSIIRSVVWCGDPNSGYQRTHNHSLSLSLWTESGLNVVESNNSGIQMHSARAHKNEELQQKWFGNLQFCYHNVTMQKHRFLFIHYLLFVQMIINFNMINYAIIYWL